MVFHVAVGFHPVGNFRSAFWLGFLLINFFRVKLGWFRHLRFQCNGREGCFTKLHRFFLPALYQLRSAILPLLCVIYEPHAGSDTAGVCAHGTSERIETESVALSSCASQCFDSRSYHIGDYRDQQHRRGSMVIENVYALPGAGKSLSVQSAKQSGFSIDTVLCFLLQPLGDFY